MPKAIGIDLGTTNSVMAVIEGGYPFIIPNEEGKNLTPSVVAFGHQAGFLVGEAAKRQAVSNPQNTIASIKRKMGTDYKVKLDGKLHTPQEISAMILYKLKNDAEAYLGFKVNQAVITVPAYFNDHQRQATYDAARIAGFEVLRIINEPTSASLTYGLNQENIHTILVWDLGGGTFDVSILELGGGIFEVKAVNGDTHLGGDDWDLRLMEYINEEVKNKYKIDLSGDLSLWQNLKEIAEIAKIELSELQATKLYFPFINQGNKNEITLTITRSLFEDLTLDFLKRMIPPTEQALKDAKLLPRDIDKVILVGGATRMPQVRFLIKELLGKSPYYKINPDEVVALGAALQAGLLTGEIKEMTLIDVLSLSLGIETQRGIFTKIINRNSIIPTSRSQIFTTADDFQTSVDIHILQGERPLAIDNLSLGEFTLENIPPSPRGVSQIEVTFKIDLNGILQVSAYNIHTEEEQKIKITTMNKLLDSEIEKIIQESLIFKDKDETRKEEVEIIIQAQDIKTSAQAFLEIHKDLEEKELKEIKTNLKNLDKLIKEKDFKKIKERMSAISHQLSALRLIASGADC